MIHLQLDRQAFYVGERVTGNVYLVVRSGELSFDSISVKVRISSGKPATLDLLTVRHLSSLHLTPNA